jgi:ATP-dependent DNA helicase RecQ
LYEFYKSHPEFENLLVTLLRTYEGIFDYPSFISESQLARLLRREEKEIKESLKKAAAFNIIHYSPQNDEPQLILKKNRVAADNLTFDLHSYQQRKERFVRRMQKMKEYVKADECRSRFINIYFGDEAAKPCGVCDHCLRLKATTISAEEFDAIKNSIFALLSNTSLDLPQLLSKLNGTSKEKARSVLNFLQAEQKITVNQKGQISLN